MLLYERLPGVEGVLGVTVGVGVAGETVGRGSVSSSNEKRVKACNSIQMRFGATSGRLTFIGIIIFVTPLTLIIRQENLSLVLS